MPELGAFAPLVGRSGEIRELYTQVCQVRQPATIVTGASGVGKTAIVDHFAALMRNRQDGFSRVWLQSLYRTSWTSTVADLRRRLDWVPQNATVSEIESTLMDSCRRVPTLLVLDNADDSNVYDVSRFLSRWTERMRSSSLIVTAQPQVAGRFDDSVPRLTLQGLKSSVAVLELLTELAGRFDEADLIDIAEQLEGNPQKLLFLNWVAPSRIDELRKRATNLGLGGDALGIEDFVESAGIPGLFFLALGIHRSFVVTDRLLTALWDRFGGRSAATYVRTRETLILRKALTPVQDYVFSIHESIHLQLEKALQHRVGTDRIPLFHNFFAEFYRKALEADVTTTNLTHFMHHSLAAKNYRLALGIVVDGRVARALATQGAAVLVRQEMEKLDSHEVLAHASAADEISLYLRLASLCNDLSDHEATLRYMARAEAAIATDSAARSGELRRQIWYHRAVSFSNLGQSDRCLQEYYAIVKSCVGSEDDLACLSLGYLTHDLKYRDLALALELGEMAMSWAEASGHAAVLPKNQCSYAESLAVAGRIPEALELFEAAARRAAAQNNVREVGRIHTNWGFALALQGGSDAMYHLDLGRDKSTTVGDRRRQTQAILYSGVARCLDGDRDGGRRLVTQAAGLLSGLGDGRYFVPAFCWAVQLSGHSPRLYPLDPATATNLRVAGLGHLVDHAVAHPEFKVYDQFWWRHFSELIGA